MTDFRVWPDVPRDEYNAIVYLQPAGNRNEIAIGFDMVTDPCAARRWRRRAIREMPAASGRVQLVQEPTTDQQRGFLIYVRSIETAASTRVCEERRKALFGFVYSPYRIDDFLAPVTTAKNYDVSFQVYDGHRDQRRKPFSMAPTTMRLPVNRRFTDTKPLHVAGRTWTVAYATNLLSNSGSSRSLLKYTLIVGCVAESAVFRGHAR